MPVLSQIVSWSQERPLWQQDALRRLVEQPVLTGDDYEALLALCKAEVGLDAELAGPARGLVDAGVGEAAVGAPAIRLTGVHSIQNVNALRDDQALSIAPSGLTVVYGDNGAGKSGYVRVLKQVCRARGARDVVHPNVYADPGGPASATVSFEVQPAAAASLPHDAVARAVTWADGVRGPDELSQVSVFDSRSASVYVTEENAVAYLPHGTDLFPRLVSVVEQVRSALEREIAAIDDARDRFEMVAPGTAVHDALSNLQVDGAEKRVQDLATVSDVERSHLEELRAEDQRLKASDPAAKAKELRRCATRLDEARARLAKLKAALNASGIADLRAAWEALDTARAAAELASGGAFADAPVGGVGSDAWRELWSAARKFAEHSAMPTRPFPIGSANDPRCVLCQQPLDGDATARMQRFEEFVRGETRAQVDRAIQELQARVRTLEGLAPHAVADAMLLEEIATLDADLVGILEECTRQLLARRDAALAAARAAEAPADWSALVHAPTGAQGRLEALATRLGEEASRYDVAGDADARRRVANAIRELEARLALDGLRDRAYAEIQRQRRKRALKQALATTNTTGITRRNTEILKEAVTEPLAEAFTAHLQALALTHLPLGVAASRGTKGRAFHTLALEKKVAGRVPMNEVLSEGEHRGVALAAFLAEIALQDSASTVVFDDPVSSMDHGRRDYVARRITEIAKTRPVVVFTHDFVFLLLMQRTADKAGVALHPRHFRRDGQRAGLIAEDLPWDGQTVKTRLGALRQMLQGFPKLATTDRPKYEADVRTFYDRLRTTWERAVEEILLNEAIRRFAKDVQTQRLKHLHRLKEQHLADLFAGMSRCSDWISGHDHAADLAAPVPEPSEATADLDALDRWVKDVRKELGV